MKLKALKKFETKEYELSRVVSWIKEFLDQFAENDTIAGSLVTSVKDNNGKPIPVVLTTATTMLPHGLGKAYEGFYVVDQDAGYIVFRDTTITNDDAGKINDKTKFIPLKATGTTTVKVWVF